MSPAPRGIQGLVLAVHPTARGFGWVLFENAARPVEWGLASAKASRSNRLVARFERLLDRCEPAVLVLEEFEGHSGRAPRIQRLCKRLIRIAGARGLATSVYRRAAVQRQFAGATTRHAVACAVADRLPDLDHRLPRKRRPWDSEDPRQSLFDAAALALTHYAVEGP